MIAEVFAVSVSRLFCSPCHLQYELSYKTLSGLDKTLTFLLVEENKIVLASLSAVIGLKGKHRIDTVAGSVTLGVAAVTTLTVL